MAAGLGQSPNMETFEAYFRRADLDSDGLISGAEAVNFFQGSNLPKHVLAQIWMYSDRRKASSLNREEFYNALRLVTVAQRGRELTPDIVKAALEGPAAAKIPAPQVNLAATPSPSPSPSPPSANQISLPRPPVYSMVATPSQAPGFSGPQPPASLNINPSQQFFPHPNGQHLRSNQASLVGQGMTAGVMAAPPQNPNPNISNLSIDWRGGGFGPVQPGPITSSSQTVQAVPANSSAALTNPVGPLSSLQMLTKDSNGFSSESVFGGGMFSASSESKVAIAPPSSSPAQALVTPVLQNAMVQNSSTVAGLLTKQTQMEIAQNKVASIPRPSDRPWPKFSPSDILRYSKVFAEVDKDRDGKITGVEARTLFLSWKLPREVLKQVWDLSDQDNDSMLSHREFATALYLMERFREGYTLPPVLPNSIKFDETLLQATSQPSMPYGGPAWQPRPGGIPQPRMPGLQRVLPPSGLKPQMQAREAEKIDVQEQPVPQKKSVPVLERHLVYQLSKEEQDALNAKLQEATDADKKVRELEKEIMDSKEKIEFYRTKMQELVLYKSRCDTRLNEITEKAASDKREVELLAKKYEEKYRNVGDVASKLTLEEATFRDIQEKKLELYNAIVRVEEGGNADGVLQVRAERIQFDVDELIKSLNERCKKYGLRVKPTTLVELPFGWQPHIEEGAADWDEEWDKYEDDGFALVKELTVDVKNIIAPPKTKSPPPVSDKANKDEISSPVSPVNEEKKLKSGSTVEHLAEGEVGYDQSEDGSVRSPSDSPAGRNSLETASQLFHSPRFSQNGNSPRLKEGSDHGGAESTFSGEKYGDEMLWGTSFDTHDDADSVWDFNNKESFHERNSSKQSSFFDSGDFGLNPIRTESPSASSVFGQEKSPFFGESLPGTPQYYSGFSPRFTYGPDGDRTDHSDAFGRFDSFSNLDARFDSFSQRESLARFDSIRSTSEQSRPGFFSFDDPDPFGSTGPFKTTNETPRRASDQWSAF